MPRVVGFWLLHRQSFNFRKITIFTSSPQNPKLGWREGGGTREQGNPSIQRLFKDIQLRIDWFPRHCKEIWYNTRRSRDTGFCKEMYDREDFWVKSIGFIWAATDLTWDPRDLIQRPIRFRRLQTADPDISIHHPIRRITLGYNVADENDHLISWTGNNVADEIVLLWDPAVIVREDGAGGWSTWWWRKWYILEWQVRGEMVRGCFWCVWWW